MHAQVFDVQVVPAHEADHPAIRTESFTDFFFRSVRESNSAVTAKLVVEEIVGPVDQNSSFRGIEIVVAAVCKLLRVLRCDTGQCSKCCLHFGGVEKRYRFTRGSIHFLQSRHVASRSFVGEQVVVAVFEPANGGRRPVEVDLLDGIENVVDG